MARIWQPGGPFYLNCHGSEIKSHLTLSDCFLILGGKKVEKRERERKRKERERRREKKRKIERERERQIDRQIERKREKDRERVRKRGKLDKEEGKKREEEGLTENNETDIWTEWLIESKYYII